MENKNVNESYKEIGGVKTIEEFAKKLVSKDEMYNGIKTGFDQLDTITKGLHKGNLILLCGRPGVGKNMFMLDIVRKMCSANKNIMLFSLCLSAEQLVKRIIPNFNSDLPKPLIRNLYFYDSYTISIEELTGKCIKMKQENLLDVLIIDRLQNVTVNGNRISCGRYSFRNEELDKMSIALKILARDLNIPIIALADIERTDDKTCINESDVINIVVNDSDVVLLMSPSKHDDNNCVVDLIVTKNKNGKIGTLRFKFDALKQCFYEEQYLTIKND